MKKQDLLTALEAVKPGLAGSERIEQSTSFVFVDNHVVTYNDEISIQHPVEGMSINGAIQANELYAFLKKSNRDEIEVKQDGNELVFTCGRSKAGFALQSEIRLPMEEIKGEKKYDALPENFHDALQFVLFSCSRDMTKPILNCVHVRTDGVVESCDNRRVTTHTLTGKPLKHPLLIPANSVRELLKYPVNKVCTSKGWVHFTDGKVVFSCRTMEDEYPDTKRVLNMGKSIKISFPDAFTEVIDRACVFSAEQKNNEVEIQSEKARIYVRAKSDTAWFEEWVRVESDSTFAFNINATFLSDILRHTRSGELSNDRIKFNTEQWLHISMLINR